MNQTCLTPYQSLARALDALPNGFPAAADGAELRLLAKLFTPEEAELAAQLHPEAESAAQIAARLGLEERPLQKILKGMARRGLIQAGRSPEGLAFGLMPFVVGIYEMQIGRIDAELAQLFEDYYHKAFGKVLEVTPSVHRVVPVGESIRSNLEIQPYESVENILTSARAWGVIDCICRVQKALIGQPCPHPIDVCMMVSQTPGIFDGSETVQALTLEEARQTLQRAAQAGLVHNVSNSQEDITYICNCCTCSCGILRGMAELGIANVVARSDYVNQVYIDLCIACGECVPTCQFGALELAETVVVDRMRCVGCGVCVLACPEGALGLVLRPAEEIQPPPRTEADWRAERAAARGLNA